MSTVEKPRRREKYITGADGYKRHQVTYTDASGITKSKRLTAKTDAALDKKIKEFNRAIGNGRALVDTATLIDDWAARWLEIKKNTVKKNTYKNYVQVVTALCSDLDHLPIGNITSMDVKRAISLHADRSASYLKKYMICTNGIFESAVDCGLLLRSPSRGIKPLNGTSGTHRRLTEDEIKRIVKIAKTHRFGIRMMMMLYAGLRRGEVSALDLEKDIDVNNKTITVSKALWFDGNKGVVGDTKSKAGVRVVPLFAPILITLNAWRERSAAEKQAAFKPITTDSVFRCGYRSFMCAYNNDLNGFRKGKAPKDESGNPVPYTESDIRSHDLRHTFCSMLYDAGVDVKTAQKWMGHSTVSITMQIYTHLSQEKEAQSKKAADKYFNQSVKKCKKYRLKC